MNAPTRGDEANARAHMEVGRAIAGSKRGWASACVTSRYRSISDTDRNKVSVFSLYLAADVECAWQTSLRQWPNSANMDPVRANFGQNLVYVGRIWRPSPRNHPPNASARAFLETCSSMFPSSVLHPIWRGATWRALIDILFATPVARRGSIFSTSLKTHI